MQDLNAIPGTEELGHVEVRALTSGDLEWITRIDAERSGRRRREYFEVKLKEAACDTGIRMSLSAWIEREPAGFLLSRLYYGEFGEPEPVAILDSIGVARRHQRHQVATALMTQLRANLASLGIERLQTQVEWNHWDLLRFFEKCGFRPAPRLCLELGVEAPR